MVTDFDTLCSELSIINSGEVSPQELGALLHWCEESLTTDIHFDGAFEEKFKDCQRLLKYFFKDVLPNIQVQDLTAPVSALHGMTSLQFVVFAGLDTYLKSLKPSPEQVNTKVNGVTLLNLAAARGYLHTTEVLLSCGANPEEQNTNGDSCIFAALMLPIDHDQAMKESKQSIYLLLSGYLKNVAQERNQSGETVLHLMAVYGFNQLIKNVLKNDNSLVFISNNISHYPIHSAILNAQHDAVKLLIAVEGSEALCDVKGRNALHYAALYGDANMVNICLHSAISKESVDKQQQTALMMACIASNLDAAQVLVASSVDINKSDEFGATALHYAVEKNVIAMVKLLLNVAKIDVNIKDSHGKTPFDLIQEKSSASDEISTLLIRRGAISGHSQGDG